MSEKKVEVLEILGRPVEETIKVNKETGAIEKVTYSMTKADLEHIQSEHGLTKEVRKVVVEVNDLVAEAAAKFIDVQSRAHGCVPVHARIGNGNGALELGITPVKTFKGTKPGTDEPYETTKYGTVTCTTNYQFSREMRAEGGLLDQIAKNQEDAIKKHKKK